MLPPAGTKNKRKHELPLSRQALAIIQRQPRRNSSPFLFSDVKGYKDWDWAKIRLDERLHIAPWRLHDLRPSSQLRETTLPKLYQQVAMLFVLTALTLA